MNVPSLSSRSALARRDLLAAALVGLLVGLAVFALNSWNDHRASVQLESLRSSVCSAGFPKSLLADADRLFSARGRQRGGRRLYGSLTGRLPGADSVIPFFESEQTLWRLGSGSGADSDGGRYWPQAIGRWEAVAWKEGCVATRSGNRLLVARTLMTPRGRYLVLVAEQYRH